MIDPTGTWKGLDIPDNLLERFRSLPPQELDDFLQRCKSIEYQQLDGALTNEDRLAVQIRIQFVDKLKKFFKTLLTKPK